MANYATYMAAMNAARKELGKEWKQVATLEKIDGQWYIQMIQKDQASIEKEVAVIEQLNAIEAEAKAKEEKKAELMANKPVHIPATPFTIPVAAPLAPIPSPALPAFLQTPPPAAPEVPNIEASAMAQGDAAANAALVAPRLGHAICPNCGSDELYTGFANEQGHVVDEDFIEGCHHCDWQVDTRKQPSVPTKVRPRLSIVALPTKLVWTIADEMVKAAAAAGKSSPKRKEVIEECVRRGVAYGTARTQYQHWFKCIADQAVAPLAVIGKDGKITMPGK